MTVEPYSFSQAPATAFPVTVTGLVVAGACIFKGLSIRNTDAVNAAGIMVEDATVGGSGMFVAAAQAAAGLSSTPVWCSEGGLLLERGCFVTVFGTGTFLASVYLVPSVRVVNVDSPFFADIIGQLSK